MRLLACAWLSLVLLMFGVRLASASDPLNEVDEAPIDEFDRDHWAYQPLAAPAIPAVRDIRWPRSSIDHFILAGIEAASLRPAGEANRETRIRRLTFDLHGLPPTIKQLDEFLADRRPDAYDRLVDRLLASPQYGRHWAQYWLDLARFAETDGFEHDLIRSTAWKFRDWVIAALNDDMPIDEFIACQIAGDVIEPNSPEAATPTAFCLSGPDMPDINSQDERKHVLLNELTATVGSVLLSLQIGCAQCHDHKYDAISQSDFYRLRAFFDRAIKLRAKSSVTTLASVADPKARSRILERGDWRSPGPTVNAAFPRVANTSGTKVASDGAGQERLALARWLTDPANPLTARSFVNRIWQFHFGTGLSKTPSDFGVMGDDPSHPLLLDHLATELITRGWSLKNLHREIVLSAVYRTDSREMIQAGQNAQSWKEAIQVDPENRLLARFPRRRLNAEAIRDSMLSVSGILNDAAGGPGVRPPLPQEMLKTLLPRQWTQSPNQSDHYRRSIYLFARRNLPFPLFATFDRPAANCSCAARQPSTTAVQSLSLLNSKLALDTSTQLAQLLIRRHSQENDQVNELYRRLLARKPTPQELQEASDFLHRQREMLKRHDNKSQALADICRAMLNSNAFLYID